MKWHFFPPEVIVCICEGVIENKMCCLSFCRSILLKKISLNSDQFFGIMIKNHCQKYKLSNCSWSLGLKNCCFSFKVRSCILHDLKIFWRSRITLPKLKNYLFWSFSVYEKLTHKIFRESDVKSAEFKPKVVTSSPFSAPKLAF